jgi:DNA-binding NtrC family response regulator
VDKNKNLNSESEVFEIRDRGVDPVRPLPDAWTKDALTKAVDEAKELARMQEDVMAASSRQWVEFPFVGASSIMKQVFSLIDKVADTDSTILILGESGTGKELVARSLHQQSSRRLKPFVPVNCGAIPSELLESELFGHVKGAYTGAHQSRMGRFTMAHQGTLFLDEIGTMPAGLQVKLLRALQEKEFEPVGSTRSVKSDCRVIAATNIDLEAEVARGTFREDLFYRLNVIPVHLPALRERREDVPLLVQHFVQRFNDKKGTRLGGFSREAMDLMMAYQWPGNVRELENICQRLCILKSEGMVQIEDLPQKIRQPRSLSGTKAGLGSYLSESFPEEGLDLEGIVTEFENNLILKALEKTRWNKNKAAQLLRMNRTTLVEKIKKRGINPAQ